MTSTLTSDREIPPPVFSLWRRQLPHYPPPVRRYTYLAVTVLATVVLYYELYVQGAVATQIIHDYGFSFSGFVFVSVVGNLVGSLGSLAAGLADRWGRANLVVVGLFITGLITLFVLPHAGSQTSYLVFFAILSVVEGIMLVATPALIRDFSPQLGRAGAMAFWTLGPVLGSLTVTMISTNTLDTHPDWRFQFYVCGIVGLVVAVLALFLLRELSPRLRDQLMVSLDDREVIEARARGIDEEAVHAHSWRQMLHLDIVGSAIGISLFLVFYYIAVGFFVVYFATIFGYSESKANAVANWYWIFNILGLLVAGYLSDKLLVRKPFMIVGAVGSIIALSVFATKATQATTSYDTFKYLMMAMSFFGGLAYCAWMAAFTETVEKRNPAATATGLAIYGWIVRSIVVITLLVFGVMLPASSTLVDKGPRVAEIASAIKPDHLAALSANPTSKEAAGAAIVDLMTPGPNGKAVASSQEKAIDDLKFLGANAAEVQKAAKDSPSQWRNFWWVAVIAQILFIPFVFVMTGRWTPRAARRDVAEYEARIAAEKAKLHV